MNHVGPKNLMSNVCCAVGNNSKMHTNKQTTEFYTCLCDGLDLDRSIQVVLEATNWVKKKTTSSLLSMSKLLQSQPLGLGKLSFITLSWTTGFLKLSLCCLFPFSLFSFVFISFFISICMVFFSTQKVLLNSSTSHCKRSEVFSKSKSCFKDWTSLIPVK